MLRVCKRTVLILAFAGFLTTIPCSIFSDFPPASEIFHPVSTTNPEAQKDFDQGLTYVFAYNHDLAYKKFEKASQLDPSLAMAYWGMALALGQNINQDVTPENEIKAYGYIQKALALSPRAAPVEQAYIQALAQRYTNDPNADLISLRFKYRNAMKKLSSDYSEDLDAACLYAESILNLDPWKYWTWDGKPKEGTLEAIDVLKSILYRNPDHVGANHFYIHAWEESPTPEEALLSAFRLTKLLPESGHLVHMPCHIFIPCGYYEDAIRTSLKAIAADRQYIKEYGMSGEYPLHYLKHNLIILVRAYMLSEQYENALKTFEELNQFLQPYYQSMPHLSKYLTTPMEIHLYFHRWKEALTLNPPPYNYPYPLTFWHFGRALAYLNTNDLDGFEHEKQLMLETKQKINPSEEIANNPALQIIGLGEILLDASLAKVQKNPSRYIDDLKQAVDKQDRFNYDEPPAWPVSIRIELGKALLNNNEDSEAEAVFKKGLSGLQRNGRLLLGLQYSLKAQKRSWDAFWVEREVQDALKYSTQKLNIQDL